MIQGAEDTSCACDVGIYSLRTCVGGELSVGLALHALNNEEGGVEEAFCAIGDAVGLP